MKFFLDILKFFLKYGRFRLYYLISFMLLAAVMDSLVVFSFGPFLELIIGKDSISNHLLNVKFFTTGEHSEINLIFNFLILIILSGLVRVYSVYLHSNYSHSLGTDISKEIFDTVLHQPLIKHLSRNSSEVLSAVTNKMSVLINGIIFPTLTLITASLILISILSVFFIVDFYSTVFFLFFILTFYFIYSSFSKNRLSLHSETISKHSTLATKKIIEGLGGIRDIIINSNQSIYLDDFSNADREMRKSQSKVQVISVIPRYVIETVVIGAVVIVASISSSENDLLSSLPILGVYAIGVQRILPFVNQAIAAIAVIRGSRSTYRDIKRMLDEKNERIVINNINFKNFSQFELRGISFRYNNEMKYQLHNINFHFQKGDIIGIIGKTGSGKSTLLDLIMGLLEPNIGQIIYNGEEIKNDSIYGWRSIISHVPQNIYLLDDSIEKNITFSKDSSSVDYEKLNKVIKAAQLEKLISKLSQGLETIIGENGSALSGGERQRIGIARCLYKGSDVLVLDEATSALDSETEDKVIREIIEFNREAAIILVTHRLGTLKNCSKVYQISNSTISLQNNK